MSSLHELTPSTYPYEWHHHAPYEGAAATDEFNLHEEDRLSTAREAGRLVLLHTDKPESHTDIEHQTSTVRETLLLEQLQHIKAEVAAVRQDASLSDRRQLAQLRKLNAAAEEIEDAIFASCRRWVRGIAYNYRVIPLPAKEKEIGGSAGLTLAINNFNPERGSSFRSFAHLYVIHGIQTLIKQRYGLSKTTQDAIATMRYIEAMFQESEGRRPTIAELRRTLQANTTDPEFTAVRTLSLPMINRLIEIRQSPIFKRAPLPRDPLGAEAIMTKLGRLLASNHPRIFSNPYNRALRQALLGMTPEQQLLICFSRGLFGIRTARLHEIGTLLGKSPQEIQLLRDMSMVELAANPALKAITPNTMSANGTPIRKTPTQQRTEERLGQIRGLYLAGMSSNEIAQHLGLSSGTVRSYVRKLVRMREVIPKAPTATETAQVRRAAHSAMTDRIKSLMLQHPQRKTPFAA